VIYQIQEIYRISGVPAHLLLVTCTQQFPLHGFVFV